MHHLRKRQIKSLKKMLILTMIGIDLICLKVNGTKFCGMYIIEWRSPVAYIRIESLLTEVTFEIKLNMVLPYLF